MKSNGKLLITSAAACLIALIVVSAGWSLATSFGLVRAGDANFMAAGRPAGALSGRGNFQPPEGFQPGGGNFQPPEDFQGGRQNFSGNFAPQAGMVGLLSAARWLVVGLSVIGLLAGTLAVIGLFKRKKWGATLAVILAVLLSLTSVFAFFRFAVDLNTGMAALKILLAIAVIVLLSLPASRRTLETAAASDSGLATEDEDLDFRTIR